MHTIAKTSLQTVVWNKTTSLLLLLLQDKKEENKDLKQCSDSF